MGEPAKSSNVLDSMMENGTFDKFRENIVNQLKDNEELRSYTSDLVKKSQTLNAADARGQQKKILFEKLRSEIENKVMERASEAAWDILLSEEGIGKEIKEKVDEMMQP
uniref:Uncharacterized protein n=1 Tax=Pyramimonas obovata TaxID=1411642 RepID=A0A7S0QPS2_9CHLO|mmetsp:Transcript_14322/g.30689  ORF Transcript_14322/g.30689 Transcript_14322/m.30689 type:complete len:109 (+) Transcript_14322:342-668(+)|eukprot:CAMPEP_0118935688 /NCGR_PEP_ID=MMETSP1169-20130426/15779_1 /TAXON_ID=36882 /ORGANISM="Pyramimonas obovata, Strain CCMP722" /LENGTH=108 /DNA_ID=CAMNT_0006878747 /DNA_START=337 /DNA_END=663 /DNA_ORIENTATION=+